ncbi:MAG: hypothetical protein P8099_08945 [Gemmatimonadota bacterium]|jgi:hypothetical protein
MAPCARLDGTAPRTWIRHRWLAAATFAALAGLTFTATAGRAQDPAEPRPATSPAATRAPAPNTPAGLIDLQLQPDEVEAVLAILDLRAQGKPIPESAWQRLFGSEGYTRMMAREDSALPARRTALHDALDAWKDVHIRPVVVQMQPVEGSCSGQAASQTGTAIR